MGAYKRELVSDIEWFGSSEAYDTVEADLRAEGTYPTEREVRDELDRQCKELIKQRAPWMLEGT